ncbi:MAG: GNAT family N-acetyltransferase, partial [bacterium]
MDDNEEKNEFKFYHYHNNINWEQYDCKNVDLEKLSQYLGTHGNTICTLLANKNENGQVGSNVNLETIMQVVEAMEAGADMRGVALAFDKKKYLDGILSGKEQKNDLEYALKDWPSKLRDSVSLEEFQMYFENAEQYLYQDPNGMLRYAELLQNEPRIRELLGGKIEKKSDLDFRLCLTVQNSDVRNWYFEGAEYIGHNALQKYFVRFNATREQTGGYPNLHDALYWIPNIKRVESGEARALLDDVNTVDESNDLRNFLARYDKERDNLIKDGQIKSLRELKKRVFAIEANIDLSTLTPEILDIISAPGFDLTQLKRFQEEPRFKELVEGKLDKEQPFLPHKRMFTARPLTELLKDGLGSFKEKIKGTAQDPKGLFNDVRKLMQDKEINGKQMQIQDLLREIPLDMEEDILKLLQDQRVATGVLLEATVHAKSDPDGWVCGNYTDCCMPFGDSKNTDYMFNKGTQYFTVKYNDRIIAQSVIVDSTDRKNNESVIILDNIEIANNYKNQAPILSRIYKTFWAEYTSLPVKIGTGHSDLTPDSAVLVSNTYSPKHSLSYSDATGSNIYDLPKIKGVESIDKILTFSNLSERDAETIAEMEKTAYPEGMVQGKGEALEVIRKSRELDLPGAASSFILRQGNEPAGYLLVLPEESKMNSNETVAHIYDMVVLPKFQGGTVARKMMERMLDTAKAYDVPAIEFEARESTSYRLITNPRIQKWMESKGYK